MKLRSVRENISLCFPYRTTQNQACEPNPSQTPDTKPANQRRPLSPPKRAQTTPYRAPSWGRLRTETQQRFLPGLIEEEYSENLGA